ncbi:hypothetical protein JB92DRAFT_2879137 [Gautieria morchelliformis]|nr:hypothetical protein JB92DRAFT_2879137 [Gautieria morchelliformis]
MSYANASYSRRPHYSDVGYGQNYDQYRGQNHDQYRGQNHDPYRGQNHDQYRGQTYDQNYGQNYGQSYGANYDPNYQSYQQPAAYAPRRHNSYNHYPRSQVAYANGTPQYVTGGRNYYPSHHGYSRHAPNVVVASGRNLARQVTPYVSTSTSARYRAEGDRGQPIPVVAGVSYRDEGIPLSTRIRRLFGLGPRRSRTHIGKSVHIKRWGFGRYGFNSTRQYTTANYGARSQDTVYTL